MAAKKTKKEEFEPEVMAEEVEAVEEPEEEKPKKAKPAKKADDKVSIFIPMIEGETPEITVGINGKFTKVRKGVKVEVSKSVAKVIMRAERQKVAALQTQEKFKDQEFDW